MCHLRHTPLISFLLASAHLISRPSITPHTHTQRKTGRAVTVDGRRFGPFWVGNWRMSQKPSRDSDSCVEWRHTTPPTCQSHSSLPLLLSSTPSYDVWIIELNSSSCKSSRPLFFSFLFDLFLYSYSSSRPHFIRVPTQPRRQSQARSSTLPVLISTSSYSSCFRLFTPFFPEPLLLLLLHLYFFSLSIREKLNNLGGKSADE